MAKLGTLVIEAYKLDCTSLYKLGREDQGEQG